MKQREYKQILTQKLHEMQQRHVSVDDIAIERNAEMMDEIQRTAERELALAGLSREWKTMNAVQAALARIADGSYGICQECEEPINERRLLAIPWVEHCIKCQERAEAEEKLAYASAA